jgi:hypothetical protein
MLPPALHFVSFTAALHTTNTNREGRNKRHLAQVCWIATKKTPGMLPTKASDVRFYLH